MKGSGPSFRFSDFQKICWKFFHDLHHPLAIFHFDSSTYAKEIMKKYFLQCTNVYDMVTDFGIWGFKNISGISREQNIILLSKKRISSLYFMGLIM